MGKYIKEYLLDQIKKEKQFLKTIDIFSSDTKADLKEMEEEKKEYLELIKEQMKKNKKETLEETNKKIKHIEEIIKNSENISDKEVLKTLKKANEYKKIFTIDNKNNDIIYLQIYLEEKLKIE